MVEEKFKHTDIGLIPVEWRVAKICEFALIVRGGSPRPAGSRLYFNGDFIPWLTVASLTNISPSRLFITTTESHLTELGSRFSRKLEKGTLIISNSGATLGVAKILKIDCCANDGIAALLEVSENIEYIAYYINSITGKLRKGVATGNGQPNLNTSLIGNLFIALPSTTEQQAIAKALLDTDEWIESLEKLIAKKRLIKPGAMQKLLTPQKDWKVKKLGEVGTFHSTNSLSRDKLSYQDGDIYNIHYGDIHTRFQAHFNIGREIVPLISPEIKLSVPTFCQAGDLVIADASENEDDIGKAIEIKFIGNKKVVAGLHTLHFRPTQDVFAKDFLGHLWQSHHVKAQILKEAQGTKVLGISANRLYDINLQFPPSSTEQLRIATILSDMDSEIEALEQKLAKAKLIKQGMMQELLTGRMRLIAPEKMEKSAKKS